MADEETPIQRLRKQIKHKDGDTRGISRQFMEVWDKDGSGQLTRGEFMQGLKTYGVLVGDMTEAEKKALWAEFDRTGDDSVDLHEFLMVLGEVYAVRQRFINEAFNKLDADGSGEISIAELKGRSDLVAYFETGGSTDGKISLLEFQSVCSAISSACDSDEDFKSKMEELTDVDVPTLPPWRYFSTTDPNEMADWVSKQHSNPNHIMGGVQQGLFHVWVRPQKRSFIKGSFTFDYVYDDNFSAEMSYADFKENRKDPNPVGYGAMSNKRLLTEPGAAALIDVDGAGNAHFLRTKTKPKRGSRFWSGKLRYLSTAEMSEAEVWLNELQPMPFNITSCIQWAATVPGSPPPVPELHLFVNDMGQTGFQYKFCKGAVPTDAIARDEALVLGFNDDGDCIYLQVPPVANQLSRRQRHVEVVDDELKNTVRNPEIAYFTFEGVCDSQEKAQQIFNAIDTDNSGFITMAEWNAVWERTEKFGVAEADRGTIRGLLRDKSKIDFKEFYTAMLAIARW